VEPHVIAPPAPIASLPLPEARPAEQGSDDLASRLIRVAAPSQISPGARGPAPNANAVIVGEAADLGRVDDLWPSLLHRSGAQRVELRAGGVPGDDLAAVEGGLNAALEDCGCAQGAVGVVTLPVLAAIGLLVGRRHAVRMRLPVASVSRDMSVLAGAVVAGGILGKTAGLLAARVRFLRLRRQLEELLKPNALE